MNAFQPASGSAPKIKGGEVAIIAILLVLGGAGFLLGRAHLAALAAELDSVSRTAEVAASRPIPASRADDAAADSNLPQPSPVEAATPAPAAAAGAAAQNPTQLRIESLQLLTSLLDDQVFNMIPASSLLSRGGIGPFANQPLPAYIVDNDGNLSPSFGAFFGLSDNDTALLQSAASSITDQITRDIRNNSTVRQTGEGAYEITIPPVTNADNLRGQFISTFRSVLGDERYQIFARLNGETSVETMLQRFPAEMTITPEIRASMEAQAARNGPSGFFNSFGSQGATITLSKANDRFSYSIDRNGGGRSSGSGGTGGRGLGGATNPMVARLQTQLGPAFELVPEDFWQ